MASIVPNSRIRVISFLLQRHVACGPSLFKRSFIIPSVNKWRSHAVLGLLPSLVRCSATLSAEQEQRMRQIASSSRVVVFIKGTPQEPRCGFSNAVCRILEAHGVLGKRADKGLALFGYFDVLESNDMREGMKAFSDWPTFPQVYFDGHFIGGCDILLEMHRSGKLTAELDRLGIGSSLVESETETK